MSSILHISFIEGYEIMFDFDVNLYSDGFRYCDSAVSAMAERIKAEWTPPIPATLHWDGKLMETLEDKYTKVERLPVLLSGICIDNLSSN
jgi:hypothetical protein